MCKLCHTTMSNAQVQLTCLSFLHVQEILVALRADGAKRLVPGWLAEGSGLLQALQQQLSALCSLSQSTVLIALVYNTVHDNFESLAAYVMQSGRLEMRDIRCDPVALYVYTFLKQQEMSMRCNFGKAFKQHPPFGSPMVQHACTVEM